MIVPYLVQRGTINRPLNLYRNERISSAIDLDYMGSAEFEFGALPKSLRMMEKMIDKASLTVLNSIQKDGAMLRVFHFFNEEEFKEYEKHLLNLWDEKIRTRRGTGFYKRVSAIIYESRTDFWWDIENHVMWSFDKEFMNHIGDYLIASLNYMNEHAKQEA